MRPLAPMALAVLLLLPQFVLADTHPLIADKFVVHVGDFVANKDVEVRVDGPLDVLGTPIDVEGELGGSGHEDALAAELRWRFGERWQVAAQLFRVSDSASATITRDIDFAGYQFQAGAALDVESGADITRVFFGRDFIRDDTRVFGIGFGLHQIELSASVAGEAYIDGVSVGSRRAAGSASGPLPNLGAWYTWAPNDRWALTGRLDWLSADIDPYDGTIVNASAGVNYRVARNFGVGLSYNFFVLNAGVSDSGWRGEVDVRYQGPYVSVSAYW